MEKRTIYKTNGKPFPQIMNYIPNDNYSIDDNIILNKQRQTRYRYCKCLDCNEWVYRNVKNPYGFNEKFDKLSLDNKKCYKCFYNDYFKLII